jgi:transporter family-2 protein
MERALAIAATLAAGALVAFQPPANSQLGKHVGSLGAAFISTLLSVTIIATLMVITGGFGSLKGISGIHPSYLLGGVAGAVIVSVSLVTVRVLGAGGVVAATVCTQLIVSAMLDRLGVLGLDRTAISSWRVSGFALLIAGTLLVTLACSPRLLTGQAAWVCWFPRASSQVWATSAGVL